MEKLKITLTNRAAKKIKRNSPVITPEDIAEKMAKLPEEWLEFIDANGQFLGQGYLGKQNKGAGWLVTRERQELTKAFLKELFSQALVKRQPFFADEQTTAFRLFNGEGDGFGGFTADFYAGFIVFSWYNQTIYRFKNQIIKAFRDVLPDHFGAYEKVRFPSDYPESSHVYGRTAPEPLLVLENGVTFATYLDEGLMTGIFLDQKEVRGQLVEGLAMGKRVLNMFSYTGAFSVAAAMGGAIETTSVDLAKRSLPKTKDQFEVNNLPLDTNHIVVMDTFEYFRYAKRKGLTFDTIVLDPPSFARNKKKTFSVSKNYGELIEDSLAILAKKGQIVASANTANISWDKFKQMIEEVLKDQQVSYQLTASYHLPADFVIHPKFAESDYLKVLVYNVVQ